MRRTWWNATALCLLGSPILLGCSQSAPAPKRTPPAETKLSTVPRPGKPLTAPTGSKPTESPAPAEDTAFAPPFMERVELFLPPSRKHVAHNLPNDVGQVLLRGFVNVDQEKALLVIDGRLKALAVGEEVGDLKVILIERPVVTLQRGRVRWTESLYPEA